MNVIRPTSAKRTLSHLLLAGLNPLSPPNHSTSRSSPRLQSPSNPSLRPLPFSSWLASIGRAADVIPPGWSILPRGLAAGGGHALIGYQSHGVHRVFAVGRNEMSQLGTGFNSQEGTRGLVEGFEGDSVRAIAAGVQSSCLLLDEGDSTAVWGFGSLQRGRLGHPRAAAPGEYREEDEPELKMLAKATRLVLPKRAGRIREMALGFEHLLLLSDAGEIYGTGCNTDGQLGLGPGFVDDVYSFSRVPLPPSVVDEGVAHVRAGADTSALITSSGALWTWGNSEYAQGLHGRNIDQIHSPTLVPTAPFLDPSRKIVDFRCGGSFALVLDDHGSVYSAGYGALGLGSDLLNSESVRRIPSLEGITRIRAGYGWAAAIRDDGPATKLFTWGVNNAAGRLGVGGTGKGAVAMHVYGPVEVELPLKELGLERDGGGGGWDLGEVECGLDALWVELVEEEGDRVE